MLLSLLVAMMLAAACTDDAEPSVESPDRGIAGVAATATPERTVNPGFLSAAELLDQKTVIEVRDVRIVSDQIVRGTIVVDRYEALVVALHSDDLSGTLLVGVELTFQHVRWAEDPELLSEIEPDSSVFLLASAPAVQGATSASVDYSVDLAFREADDGAIESTRIGVAFDARSLATIRSAVAQFPDRRGPSDFTHRLGVLADAVNDPSSGVRELLVLGLPVAPTKPTPTPVGSAGYFVVEVGGVSKDLSEPRYVILTTESGSHAEFVVAPNSFNETSILLADAESVRVQVRAGDPPDARIVHTFDYRVDTAGRRVSDIALAVTVSASASAIEALPRDEYVALDSASDSASD